MTAIDDSRTALEDLLAGIFEEESYNYEITDVYWSGTASDGEDPYLFLVHIENGAITSAIDVFFPIDIGEVLRDDSNGYCSSFLDAAKTTIDAESEFEAATLSYCAPPPKESYWER